MMQSLNVEVTCLTDIDDILVERKARVKSYTLNFYMVEECDWHIGNDY